MVHTASHLLSLANRKQTLYNTKSPSQTLHMTKPWYSSQQKSKLD
jgi:hypothetical protein